MGKNEIQTARMFGYFLESAKNIIKSEGIEALTVRSVADKAGYSYGTLYNYYKDVKELVFKSGVDFMQECIEYISNNNYGIKTNKEIIIAKTHKYIEFFVQYTGIYQLLFITPRNNIGKFDEFKNALVEMNSKIFGKEFEEIYGELSNLQLDLYMTFVSGSLLMYINRSQPNDFLEFRKKINAQIEILLNK